ncbi:hypothetical protein A3740_15015 [Oleiphilus sp. HI0068]|nr:hypothetical protein A3740_15015 [Oleiphilus sp. HI0068]
MCLSAKSTIKAVAGFPIEELLTEYEEAKAFVEKKSLRVPFLPILENSWQSYLKHEYLLGDENFEATSLAIINGSSFKAFLMYCRFEYFFWDEADCETLVAHLFDAVASYGLFKSHFMMVDLYCLSNLAFIRAQREGFVGASHQAFKKLEKVSNELKHILQLRADLYSLNHEHKIALVEAEQLALDGAPFEQTAKRYKQAIKEAEENGFRQYAGLSNEFFGRYLIDIGFESLADVPIKRAHSWYKSWGNKAKIDRLLACYPELAISEKRDKTVPATFSNSSNVTLTQQFSTGLSATSSVRSGEALDFQSIIKSMQTLSGELDLHNLIESMMKVILENAGAHIGVLVVQSLKGPKVEAQVDLPNDQASYLMHIPLEKSVNVPQDIINLTLRLGETIWLENACADGEFKEDAYISKARSKSVLCLPIVYRKSQIGALYLENSLSTGVFTEQRMSVIKVLLTQAAISLENARLFDEVTGLNAGLEEKVAQRTRDLDQANVELASANKELESFSYTVSHDLKSPLRMIKGFSDILLDDYASQLDEEAQRILAKVVAGAKSMEDLINGLLDLSRMQRKEVKRTDLNLSQIADTVVANLRDTYPLRVVDIYIQPDMNINGDARMMHSVVENLINNAWKYSSKTESAEIAFSSALVDDELGRTERVFKVKDNGAGFDMSHAGKLFSTFQRLHNKSDFDGTGVGLSTVKRIVEKHGGRVWADSEVGKGASFYFTIPEQ